MDIDHTYQSRHCLPATLVKLSSMYLPKEQPLHIKPLQKPDRDTTFMRQLLPDVPERVDDRLRVPVFDFLWLVQHQ